MPPRPVEQSTLWFGSGRQALHALFAALAPLGTTSVWLPEYHCRSMVTPCAHAGVAPRFYAVDEMLAPRLDTLADVRAHDVVVGVHYFGRPFDLRPLAALASRSGALLLEDAAHVPHGSAAVSNAIGALGDFVLHCPRKFSRAYDGALLRGDRAVLRSITQQTPSLREQVKSFAAWLERPKHATGTLSPGEARAGAPEGWVEPRFDVRRRQRTTAASRLAFGFGRPHAADTQRRRRYAALHAAARDTRLLRPLFPDLPQGMVPYMYPAVLNDAGDFAKLRAAGVNVLRWEDFAAPLSAPLQAIESRLVQLPVTEAMPDSDFHSLVRRVAGETP
jgi:perosamine synthetase